MSPAKDTNEILYKMQIKIQWMLWWFNIVMVKLFLDILVEDGFDNTSAGGDFLAKLIIQLRLNMEFTESF